METPSLDLTVSAPSLDQRQGPRRVCTVPGGPSSTMASAASIFWRCFIVCSHREPLLRRTHTRCSVWRPSVRESMETPSRPKAVGRTSRSSRCHLHYCSRKPGRRCG